MITNQRTFISSILILLVMMVFTIPFPHNHPLGEDLFTAIGLPTHILGGLLPVGIISIALLITGLILIRKSFAYYRNRMMLLALVLVFMLPNIFITLYQSTFAKGIYAIGYESEESTCDFEMLDDATLNGECSLYLINHSNQLQTFTLTFNEHFPDDTLMLTLMNDNGPVEITLQPKEERNFTIEKQIDVRNLNNYIQNGNASTIPITITANGKTRDL